MRGSALHWAAQGPGLGGRDPVSPTPTGSCEVDFDMSLAQPQASRNERRGLLQDKGWKKSNPVLSMFTRAYVPPEVSYIVTLTSRVMGHWRPPPSKTLSAGAGAASPCPDAIGWLGWQPQDILAAAAAAVRSGAIIARDTTATTSSSSASNNSNMVTFQEEFLVCSVLGAGRARDVALKDPFRPLKLPPFVTIACKVTIDEKETYSYSLVYR